MNFPPTVQIIKPHRVGAWCAVTICLDAVDGLGTFLELETMAQEDEAGAATQERLHKQVMALGLAVERVALDERRNPICGGYLVEAAQKGELEW